MRKGLEAITSPISTEIKNGKQYYTYKKEDIDIAEKELKAFDIIKEKKVNIYNLKTCKSYEKYVATLRHNYEIFNLVTKEEYDLLKEVLQ